MKYLCIQIGKDKFHLSHQFDKYNGVAMPTGSQLGVGGVPLPGEDLRPKNSVYPRANHTKFELCRMIAS